MTVKDYMLDLWCQLGADQCNSGQFTLTTLELTRMDAAGICAISLLPPPGSGTANRHKSLLGQIDMLLYFAGMQVTEKNDYGSCCRLDSVPWFGHWPIVLMRRLLGLSHSCLLPNPYLCTIYESHFRIMFCLFE